MPAWHWQAVEAVLAGRERAREGHAKHTAAVFAATSELNWFAGQVYGIHAESPDAAFEVAGAHAMQSAPPLPVYPALHVQLLILVAPPSEDECIGQFEHAAEPVAALNVPAPHCVHTAPFAPVYPALHSHASATPLPTGECEFRGHA